MSEKSCKRGLVWLRNDLRTDDNTALYRASTGCESIATVFIAFSQTCGKWRLLGGELRRRQ